MRPSDSHVFRMSHKFDIKLQMTDMHAAPDKKWLGLLQFHTITIQKHPFVLNQPPTYKHIPKNLFLQGLLENWKWYFGYRRLTTKYSLIANNAK